LSNEFFKEYSEPFQHWTVDNFLTAECLTELKSIEHFCTQAEEGRRVNSERLFIHTVPKEAMPELWKLQESVADGQYRMFFEHVTKQSFEGTFPRIEVISDFGDFELSPHHDHLEKKLSAMVYTDHEELYPGTVLGDSYQVEAKDNRCMFFVPSGETWHHYPKTNFTKVRRGLMINYWTYQV